MNDSWKLTLPCNRAEAEAVTNDLLDWSMTDPAPTIVTSEIDEAKDIWQLDAYFDGKPSTKAVQAIVNLLPGAAKKVAKGHRYKAERLPDDDWVTMSQQGLEPVRAGRFHVHTPDDAPVNEPGVVNFRIGAGRAFGTGHHETTAGCLAMLDRLRREGRRYGNVIDIGTGTGLLAFAARHLWPRAYFTASDIDPVSIDVTAANGADNAVPLGRMQGKVALAVANGTAHPLIINRAPYDLIIANILAGPLIELASSVAAIAEDGATVLLAGLLETQQDAVVAAWRRAGFRLERAAPNGDWPTLHLVKRPRSGWRRPTRASGHTAQPPGDFGSW